MPNFDQRKALHNGKLHTFHPTTSAHSGFIYRQSDRLYGEIHLTGLGWTFFSRADLRARAREAQHATTPA